MIALVGDLYQILHDVGKSPQDKLNELMTIYSELEEFPSLMYPMIDPESWAAKHQTLVVFEVVKTPSWTWQERAARFASSLNHHDTIKADILSVADGDLYEGLIWTGKTPGGISYLDMRKLSATWGYNQMLFHGYVGAL